MNDKLQIRDLIAMLQAPGIDQRDHIEVWPCHPNGYAKLRRAGAGLWHIGSMNTDFEIKQAEIRGWKSAEGRVSEKIKKKLVQFIDSGEKPSITQILQFIEHDLKP